MQEYIVELSEDEIEAEPTEISEEDKKMFCYMMEKDLDSGYVEIYPMNDSDHITIHGVEEAELFTKMLLDCFQTA